MVIILFKISHILGRQVHKLFAMIKFEERDCSKSDKNCWRVDVTGQSHTDSLRDLKCLNTG